MDVGTGVFLSGAFFSLIFLYTKTRDSWKWKKISIYSVLFLVIAPAILLGAFTYYENYYHPQPVNQTELWGISLGDSEDDVIFKKGNPKSKDGYWVYSGSFGNYLLLFEDGRVDSIIQDEGYISINEIAKGDSSEKIYKVLGKPNKIAKSDDKTQRRYCYKDLNMVIFLEKDSVIAIAVADFRKGDTFGC